MTSGAIDHVTPRLLYFEKISFKMSEESSGSMKLRRNAFTKSAGMDRTLFAQEAILTMQIDMKVERLAKPGRMSRVVLLLKKFPEEVDWNFHEGCTLQT